MHGKTTVEFLEYLDRVYRKPTITKVGQWRRNASDLDIGEAWAEVMLFIYREAFTAERFNSLDHLWAYCFATTRKYYIWRVGNNDNKYMHMSKGEYVFKTIFMGSLEDESLDTLIKRNRPSEEKPAMSASTGWVQEALGKMTDKQREAILSVRVAGASTQEYAEQTGVKKDAVQKQIRRARRVLIDHAPTEFLEKSQVTREPKLATA
jgi:RNA polymerase sigma factor (sigma-70 family)